MAHDSKPPTTINYASPELRRGIRWRKLLLWLSPTICLAILFGGDFIASNKYTGTGSKEWIYVIGKYPDIVGVGLVDNNILICGSWKVSGNIFPADSKVHVFGIIYQHECDSGGVDFKVLYIAWWSALVLTALATGLLYFIVRFSKRKLNT